MPLLKYYYDKNCKELSEVVMQINFYSINLLTLAVLLSMTVE